MFKLVKCAPIALTIIVSGCFKGEEKQIENAAINDKSPTIAKVNDWPVSQSELDYAIERTLGNQAAYLMTEALNQKILKSLIASKAIAKASLQELSEDKKKLVELQTAAYREELLVKLYLEEHVTPEPVTTDMVKKYYHEHQASFSDGVVKAFEMLKIRPSELSDNISEKVAKLKLQKNWQQLASQLKNDNPDWLVDYKKAVLADTLLKEPVKSLLVGLQPGESAPLHISGDQFLLLKLIENEPLPVKPLAEVSASIRKQLAPLQLKEAISSISNQLVEEADVEIFQ